MIDEMFRAIDGKDGPEALKSTIHNYNDRSGGVVGMKAITITCLAIMVAGMLSGCLENHAVRSGNATIDVIARGLTFEAPTEVPAGWSTFRFINRSPMVHFALIEKLSEGHGIAEQQSQVAPVFQQGMDLLAAGKHDAALAKFGELPPWFGDIVFLGGPGFTGPGRISEATVYLEPGTYLIECYIKTNGIFHSYNPDPSAYGMVHEFRVIPAGNAARPPVASLHVRVSSASGIEMTGTPVAGKQTVEVEFLDQSVHENFVGHDVHLVRLAEDSDLEQLERWMDWRQPSGLQTPAPVEFIGGLNEMPAGRTGFISLELEPGAYAWIAEVPGARAKNMLHRFVVGSGSRADASAATR